MSAKQQKVCERERESSSSSAVSTARAGCRELPGGRLGGKNKDRAGKLTKPGDPVIHDKDPIRGLAATLDTKGKGAK